MPCDAHEWFQGFVQEHTDVYYSSFDISKNEKFVAQGGYEEIQAKALVTVHEIKANGLEL